MARTNARDGATAFSGEPTAFEPAAKSNKSRGQVDAIQGRWTADVQRSPLVAAQRRTITTLFGGSAQLAPAPRADVRQRARNGDIYSVVVAPVRQETLSWCFAATSVMLRRYLGETITQRDVVTQFLVEDSGMDREALSFLTDDEFREDYGKSQGIEKVPGEEADLSRQHVMDMLEADMPVVIGISGHSYVATRFDARTDELTLIDPNSGNSDVWLFDGVLMMDGVKIRNFI
jgi:hypothetical protein